MVAPKTDLISVRSAHHGRFENRDVNDDCCVDRSVDAGLRGLSGATGMIEGRLATIIIVIISTVFVVVVVLGLHIWGAIQDGREEKAMWSWRHRQ